MLLTTEQKQLIIDIDRRVKKLLLADVDEEKVLISMYEYLPKIKTIVKSVSKPVFDQICCEYDGFFKLIKLIKKLTKTVARGTTVPD